MRKELRAGEKYGKLTILMPRSSTSHDHQSMAWCHCECGTDKLIRENNIKSGKAQSCGLCVGRGGDHKSKIFTDKLMESHSD